MVQARVKVESNEEVAPLYYRMALDAPSIAKDIRPGEFLHIRCSESYDPLLRRPFSVHRIRENSLEILYRVVGKGTQVLSERKEGDLLSVLGPLGNGFTIDEEVEAAILVAGGIGIAPLVALGEELVQGSPFDFAKGPRSTVHGKKVYFLIGARTRELILYERELKDLGIEVRVSTDDGSYGQKGMVTDLLKDLLTTYPLSLTTALYACGPEEMFKEVAALSGRYGLKAQGSLEERMGCGLGACLGCVIKIQNPKIKNQNVYKRVCKDGPIFDLSEVVWE